MPKKILLILLLIIGIFSLHLSSGASPVLISTVEAGEYGSDSYDPSATAETASENLNNLGGRLIDIISFILASVGVVVVVISFVLIIANIASTEEPNFKKGLLMLVIGIILIAIPVLVTSIKTVIITNNGFTNSTETTETTEY